jgi:hypothetical protein
VDKKRQSNPARDYQIGYRKPPLDTRFKKGKSGNPKGRPKGTQNFATVLLRTLREQVVINENGRRREITKLEAAVKQLVNKAATGDLRALSQLISLTITAEQSAAAEMTPNQTLSDVDQKVFQRFLKRYEQSLKEGETHGKSKAEAE